MSTDGRYRCCRFFVSKELDAHPIGGGKFFDKAIRENTAGVFLRWGLFRLDLEGLLLAISLDFKIPRLAIVCHG